VLKAKPPSLMTVTATLVRRMHVLSASPAQLRPSVSIDLSTLLVKLERNSAPPGFNGTVTVHYWHCLYAAGSM